MTSFLRKQIAMGVYSQSNVTQNLIKRFTYILAGTALALSGAGEATASPLRLERLDAANSAVVASTAHKTTAYLSGAGQLVVGSAGRGGRTVAIPTSCTPVATSSTVVALSCSVTGGRQVPAVVDLATGKVSPLTLPANSDGRVNAIGEQWATVDAESSPDDLHVVHTRVLINWRTGQNVSLGRDDPYGARRYIDLDRASPGRTLCSPIRRLASDDVDNIKFVDTVKQGQWTLTFESLHGPLVQHCGQRTRRRLPRVSQPVLGNDFVGYIDKRQVVYLDLRTGKRKTRAWPTAQRPTLAAAGRRLIISAPTADAAGYQLYRAG